MLEMQIYENSINYLWSKMASFGIAWNALVVLKVDTQRGPFPVLIDR